MNIYAMFSRRLLEASAALERAKRAYAEERAAWFHYLDDTIGSGNSFLVEVDDTLQVLGREYAQSAPTLNIEALKAVAPDVWEAFSYVPEPQRILDEVRLREAAKRSPGLQAILAQCSEQRPPIARLVHRPMQRSMDEAAREIARRRADG